MISDYLKAETDVKKAANAYLNKEFPSIRAAAAAYAPNHYSRVKRRVKGIGSRSDRDVTNARLSEEQERAIRIWLSHLDKLRTRSTLKLLAASANLLLRRQWLAEGGDGDGPEPIGEHWPSRFIKRNPQYKLRLDKSRERKRIDAEHLPTLEDWYRRFQATRIEHQIQDCDLYNYDESGIRIGEGNSEMTIVEDMTKDIVSATSLNRELITVGETISATGEALPPLIILKGVRIQQRWIQHTDIIKSGPMRSALLATSDSSYINDLIALDWLEHFDKHSKLRQQGAKRMLLLDGHESHLTVQFIERCLALDIILFLLVPHTTHLCQPLDVSVFQPYKRYHGQAVSAAMRLDALDFDKMDFLRAIGDIRKRALKHRTIVSGWRKSGLIPFAPDVVLNRLRGQLPPAPSTPTTTDDEVEPEIPRTPRTFWELRVASTKIMRSHPWTPRTKQRLTKFVSGALSLADVKHLDERAQAKQQAYERRKRQEKEAGTSYIQEGGTISVEDAHDICEERVAQANLKKDAQERRRRTAQLAHEKRLLTHERGLERERMLENEIDELYDEEY